MNSYDNVLTLVFGVVLILVFSFLFFGVNTDSKRVSGNGLDYLGIDLDEQYPYFFGDKCKFGNIYLIDTVTLVDGCGNKSSIDPMGVPSDTKFYALVGVKG